MADHALIVGATGIIGNALVERLVENGGWAISGLARQELLHELLPRATVIASMLKESKNPN